MIIDTGKDEHLGDEMTMVITMMPRRTRMMTRMIYKGDDITIMPRMTRIMTTGMIEDDDSETIAATSQVAVRRPLTMSLSINPPSPKPHNIKYQPVQCTI